MKSMSASLFINLPEAVKNHYDEEASRYINLSEHIESEKAAGRAEGEAKGRAEGEAKGRAEGEVKGRAEGEAKGKSEGRIEEKRKMVRDLLEHGAQREMIKKITGFSEEELTALQDL